MQWRKPFPGSKHGEKLESSIEGGFYANKSEFSSCCGMLPCHHCPVLGWSVVSSHAMSAVRFVFQSQIDMMFEEEVKIFGEYPGHGSVAV